jgi:hypothetical protein
VRVVWRLGGAAGAAGALALALAGTALAADVYPEPAPSGTAGPPRQGARTLHVCHGRRTCFPRIQDAVNEARPGDTIRVARGTWRGGVRIVGPGKRGIRLIGAPAAPATVVVDGRRADGTVADGVLVAGADRVTVSGLTVQGFARRGVVVARAAGVRLSRVRALGSGGPGFAVGDAVGGTLRDLEAAGNGGAGFAFGPTAPESRPVRTVATGLSAHDNAAGWWGANARYVTLQNSKFYNNGVGVLLTARDAVGVAPPEDTIITGNLVYDNDRPAPSLAPGELPALVGVGVLVLGGRRTVVSANAIYGNALLGVGVAQQALASAPDAGVPSGNEVQGNAFGLGGADPNGRDIVADGAGAGNCFGPNDGAGIVLPAGVPACPFEGSFAGADVAALLADAAGNLVSH